MNSLIAMMLVGQWQLTPLNTRPLDTRPLPRPDYQYAPSSTLNWSQRLVPYKDREGRTRFHHVILLPRPYTGNDFGPDEYLWRSGRKKFVWEE